MYLDLIKGCIYNILNFRSPRRFRYGMFKVIDTHYKQRYK